MKSNRFYPKHAMLGLLMLGFVATTSIQAQMVQEQSGQQASTAPFEAIMYPVNGPLPAIRVNFNNLSGGSVRIVMRNAQGIVLYDEYEASAYCRRRFDLSSMPAGEYTVQLSKRNKQQTQTFVIDGPVGAHIAMKSEPTQSTDKNIAVKQ